MFYGCNLAATADGQELMNQIGAEWDVDVAASDDLTGILIFGGDWDLEYQTGDVETQIAFSTDLQRNGITYWPMRLITAQMTACLRGQPRRVAYDIR